MHARVWRSVWRFSWRLWWVIHCQTLTRRIKGKLCAGDEWRLVVIRSRAGGRSGGDYAEAHYCNLNSVLLI